MFAAMSDFPALELAALNKYLGEEEETLVAPPETELNVDAEVAEMVGPLARALSGVDL